ncbi:phage minor head protein [Streptomyces sp. TRM68367]|uniref:phage minor head protein n=1 Tax=Streptomyces sp. TRM68367 TaxID=2758415 RepID=UPI002935333D|nr:phage minor head protein [Streptomyces sp. TRM68367]
MNDDELEAALEAAEEDVAREVRAILAEVAEEYATALDAATELVAARFSVSRIASMWTRRVPRLMRRLLGVAETAAETAATQVGDTLPDGWDDLPGRYDDDTLPAQLGDYVTSTEHLLNAVGERLATVATRELAEGLNAGEDVEQLRARLRAAFDREGVQLGASREELIARTESSRAWNSATLAAAQAMTGPDRPLVKQWRIHNSPQGDSRVRDPHRDADGQVRLLGDAFQVGGVDMQAPGDPTAPPELTCNCRCVLVLATAERTASFETQAPVGRELSNPRDDDTLRQLIKAADKVAVLMTNGVLRPALEAAGVKDPERFHVAFDTSPLPILRKDVMDEVTAAAEVHTGAMVALMPSEEDVERLAFEDGEPPEELHLTLCYLGEGADWTDDQRNELAGLIRARAEGLGAPVAARAFGVNHWNPGEDGVWVWAVGDDRDQDGPGLATVHNLVYDALESTHERPEVPAQHSPWAAHVTGAYTGDRWPLKVMLDRLGPITFDRIRLAFAGEHTDIPLRPDLEAAMATPAEAEMPPPPVRTWSTPDGAALAFENEETGDNRVFASGALYWDGAGPWPLQYAEAMGEGHNGAELAGSFQTLGRDGDRLTGNGVLYLTQPAGYDAALLLDQNAPLGVSVDLDDVSVQLVDTTTTPGEGDEEPIALAASFASASVMRLDDGSWMITGRSRAEWTASGIEMAHSARSTLLFTSPGGRISAATARRVFPEELTAAAGDTDDPEAGVVFHEEHAGDFLVRITRARVRGATLVAMPAYDKARIVLDPPEEQQAAAAPIVAASGDDHQRVITYVCSSPTPVSAPHVANALALSVDAVRSHLARALDDGHVVRLTRGLYVGPSTIPEGEATAAADADADALYDQRAAEILASAWQVMQTEKPMPAAWFAEPTPEELPPGSGGVHIVDGRAYGWVAQRGVPHAVHGKKVTIEKLAARGLDLSHFLRTQFLLDDGSEVRAGAMTMNVGHHRDGFECETAVCQFDDSRTVGAVVTVGMNEGGMWFSGAAAPWLSQWDRTVFQACQPSYHMTQGNDGRWQLKAVLSVPVPGHSSPLTAAAVVDRSNLALTAAAAAIHENSPAVAEHPAPADEPEPEHTRTSDEAPAVSAVGEVTAALLEPAFLDQFSDALRTREQERAAAARAELAELTARLAPVRAELAASAAPQPERN